MSSRSFNFDAIKQLVPRSYKMRWRMVKYNYDSLPKFQARYGRNGKDREAARRILFYPETPWESSVMYQMCLELGYRMVNNPRQPFDAAIQWRDTTIEPPNPVLVELSRSCQVINLYCTDISKRHVDEMFREVFGYGTLVDPTTHQGPVVQKSNLNAQHNGRIVQCPVEKPDPDSIYQILIDSQVDEKKVMDHRVPVIKGQIPCVLRWYKPVGKRFEVEIHRREIVKAGEVFSQEEIEKILRMAERMHLDYGEMDVLRDRNDGRIYIVDVNTTPDGPPADALDDPINRESIRCRAELFDALVVGIRSD